MSRALGNVCARVRKLSFHWTVLVLIFQDFPPEEASQPVQPFLAWSVGNAPDFDNGENLGPCAPTCSEAFPVLSALMHTPATVLADSPSQPQAHVCRHAHTCLSTLGQTHWYEHTYVHLQRLPVPPRHVSSLRHRERARRSHSEGHETDGVPGAACFSEAGVHPSQSHAYSCWRDTGPHCAARHRGTMRACFLQLPTALPSSPGPGSPAGWGLGAQLPVSEDWGNSPEDMFRMRTSWGTPGLGRRCNSCPQGPREWEGRFGICPCPARAQTLAVLGGEFRWLTRPARGRSV